MSKKVPDSIAHTIAAASRKKKPQQAHLPITEAPAPAPAPIPRPPAPEPIHRVPRGITDSQWARAQMDAAALCVSRDGNSQEYADQRVRMMLPVAVIQLANEYREKEKAVAPAPPASDPPDPGAVEARMEVPDISQFIDDAPYLGDLFDTVPRLVEINRTLRELEKEKGVLQQQVHEMMKALDQPSVGVLGATVLYVRSTRVQLDKHKLLEQGVTPQQIENSITRTPYTYVQIKEQGV